MVRKLIPILLLIGCTVNTNRDCNNCDSTIITYDTISSISQDWLDSLQLDFELRESKFDSINNDLKRAMQQLTFVADSLQNHFDSVYLLLADMSILNIEDFLNYGNMVIIDTANIIRTAWDSTGKPYLLWKE